MRTCAVETRSRSRPSRLERGVRATAAATALAVAEVAITRSHPVCPEAAERRVEFGLYVLVHLVDLAGGRRIVLEERLAQADRAERLGVRIQQVPAVGRDDLGAAAADIDDQDTLVALRPNALHSQMDQPRLFAARNDFHRRADCFRRACQKFALIARVANRAGGHHAHAHHVELADMRRPYAPAPRRWPSMRLRSTAPLRKTLSPRRVTSRSDASTRAGRPGTTSAASIRIELLPISIAA